MEMSLRGLPLRNVALAVKIQAPKLGKSHAYCFSSDKDDLNPGMIIAITTHPGSTAAYLNGHIGLYMGNGIVRDYGGMGLKETPLDYWIGFYGISVAPRWGWYSGVELS